MRIKAYQLMALAAENPEKYEGKRYKVVGGSNMYACGSPKCFNECSIREGLIIGGDSNYNLFVSSDTELEETKLEPIPVDFMTAVNSGKNIMPASGTWAFMGLSDWLNFMSMSDGIISKESASEYINGKWIIEDEPC